MNVQINPKSASLVLVFRQRRFHLDRVLLMVALSLLLLGYIMVTSASLHLGEKPPINNAFYFPKRQFIHILVGLVAAGMAASVRLESLEKMGQWLFMLGLALLIVVLIPGFGREVNGSVRWLVLGGVGIQVSELVKLISVIYMAGYISRHGQTVRASVQGIVRPLILLSLACILLLLEPDFGAAVVILATALAMMFIGGAKLGQFALLMLLVSALGFALIYASPYRWERIISFLNPWADPLDSGFQLVQALIAFGRGEWTGVGLGASVQKLFYLPEGHTDFLFSVIGEELGLLGTALVIALFALLVFRAFRIARLAEIAGKRFAALLAYGLGIWFGLQAFINMGVNMGLLPTKGLTLPLMSYGGGSMVVMCVALALLFRIHHEAAAANAGTLKEKRGWLRAL